jgi:serine/threonine protein kinase
MPAKRNLLLGILALQNNFITRGQLLAAFNAWVEDKSKSLGALLLEQKALTPEHHALLEALTAAHLQQHGDDADKSLAALSSAGSARRDLEQIGDPDVQASLASLPVGQAFLPAKPGRQECLPHGDDADPYATVSLKAVSAGRFIVLRPHAAGGLGQVSVALDQELNRQVALKEIKEKHADDAEARSRFLLEAEITGGLEHPGIVPIYSLGTYADGRPFYAMRFIKGDSLKEAVDRFHKRLVVSASGGSKQPPEGGTASPDFHSLDFRKLLGRFVDVCNAIAYAHSRGVLHRDLKPGNIMLGKYGETLVVDWGLAKAGMKHGEPGASATGVTAPESLLRPASGSGSSDTLPGSALGTPVYMSPEQAGGRLDQLGPASDVYALGATLYHLLTGTAPFSGAPAAVLEQVQQGAFAGPRQVQPDLPPALEAICLKAMSLRPADRYAAPRELADDLERWLADEPVSAWPEPLGVRVQRWIRQHRTLVGSVAAALVVATVGSIGSAALLAGVNHELDERNQALDQANGQLQATNAKLELARRDAETKRQQAEEQRQVALAVRQFLQNDLLLQADPTTQADRLLVLGGQRFTTEENPTIKELLDRAAAELTPDKINAKFPKQLSAQVEILHNVGTTYLGVGEYAKAISHFERARALAEAHLGPNDRGTLRARTSLAAAYDAAGKLDAALPLFEETLKLLTAAFGPDEPDTLDCMNGCAGSNLAAGKLERATALFQETVERDKATFGPAHRYTLTAMNNLAYAYFTAGKLDLALPLFEETLDRMKTALGPDHPRTLWCMGNLAGTYQITGKIERVLPMQEETLERVRAKHGPDHPDTLLCMSSLGAFYGEAGKMDRAIPLLEEALPLIKLKLGPDHRNTLVTMGNLGLAYVHSGKLEEGLSLLKDAHERATATLGPHHPDTLLCTNNLAQGYDTAGKVGLALPVYEQALKGLMAKHGPSHPHTLLAMNNVAHAYKDAGRPDLALPRFEETVKRMTTTLGPTHPLTLVAMANLAGCYRLTQGPERSIPLYEETLEGMRTHLGIEHPHTLTTMNDLALAYMYARKFDQAVPLLQETLKLRKAKFGPTHPDTLVSINNLAGAYRQLGKLEHALPLFVEAYEGRKATLGEDHPRTLISLDNLALTYQGLGRLDRALPLFDKALAGFKASSGADHPDTLICMQNAAKAHLQAGHVEKALPLFRALITAHRNRPDRSEPRFAGVLADIGVALLKAQQFNEAEPLLRECLTIRIKTEPDLWTTFNSQATLGASLLGQKKYQDAEPLLQQGFDGMKRHEKTIPPQGKVGLVEAAEHLVALYEATARKDEAQKWAAVLVTLDGKLLPEVHDAAEPLMLKGELDAAVPSVIFQVRLKAGVRYVIDMASPDPKALDPYLFLQDSERKTLVEDDDSGGDLNARITFRAPVDGVYRLRATSFNGGRGPFTISVRPERTGRWKGDRGQEAARKGDADGEGHVYGRHLTGPSESAEWHSLNVPVAFSSLAIPASRPCRCRP